MSEGTKMPLFDHFDILAPFYDRFIKTSDLSQLIEIIGLPVDGILLDAGGGTGRISSTLASYVKRVIIADLSLGMLKQAATKDALIPLCSTLESMPFNDAIFEKVIMVDALHHVIDHRQTAFELWRVVKPGGRIVIEEPNIQKPAVWIVALLEKLALMRSHFKSPAKIAAMFNFPGAHVAIHKLGYTAWVIVDKLP